MSTDAQPAQHCPEPWRIGEFGDVYSAPIVGGCRMVEAPCKVADIRGWGHLQYRADGEAMMDANGKRIVACVNALAGIPDPADFVRRALAAGVKP